MGEFVGIDPRGALELIRRMEAGEALLGRTRPRLDAAIDEAGQDWAGHQGSTALHRALGFFHESRRELKWRIDTIEQLVPVRERGLLTATFPFDGEAEARRSAEETADTIRTALETPPTDDDSPTNDRARADDGSSADDGEGGTAARVGRVLSDVRGEAGDPAYAAALLAALGPHTLVRLLEAVPDDQEDAPAGAPAGTLARAFASAERTGRLGEEWQAFAETAPPHVLTSLIAHAGQSGPFLNRAALTLLDRPDPAWDPHGLVTAYAANPLAFQQFLAEQPAAAETLLSIAAGDPALAGALHEALRPEVGADGLRQRAWSNVLRGVGATLRVEDG
ncbi:hypothetical protein AB0I81_12645 [Nonomuraea sp. NPDC050404]|uniref:hypothetical protein n=1 Tax=Nonomuraea sp. NPDC050404 TaxID=3155783 RepID=UPI0033D990BC